MAIRTGIAPDALLASPDVLEAMVALFQPDLGEQELNRIEIDLVERRMKLGSPS